MDYRSPKEEEDEGQEGEEEEEEEEEVEEPIDGARLAKWRRWARGGVVFAAILNRMITFGNYYAAGVFFLPILCHFHSGRAATAGIVAVTMLFLCLAGPLAKYVTSRYHASACFLCGAVLSTIGLTIASHSDSIFELYIFYGFMLGIGLSFVFTATLADTPTYFSTEQLGQVFAMTEGGSILGMGIVPFFVDMAMEQHGWRTTMLGLGVATGLGILPSVFLFRPWFKYEFEEPVAATTPTGRSGREGDGDVAIGGEKPDRVVEKLSGYDDPEPESPPTSPSAGLLFGQRYYDVTVAKSTAEQKTTSANQASPPMASASKVSDKMVPRRPVLQPVHWHWSKDVAQSDTGYWGLYNSISFKLFCTAACLYHFLLTVPIIFLVDASLEDDVSRLGGGTLGPCTKSHRGGTLYVLVAVGMAVGFPLCGYAFDRLSTLKQKAYLIAGIYVVCAAVVGMVPLASESWQMHFAAFALGLALSPNALHYAFLNCLLGRRMYARGLAVFVFAAAVVQAVSLPVAGALRDAYGNFLLVFGVASILAVVAATLQLLMISGFLERRHVDVDGENRSGCPCVGCLTTLSTVYPV